MLRVKDAITETEHATQIEDGCWKWKPGIPGIHQLDGQIP